MAYEALTWPSEFALDLDYLEPSESTFDTNYDYFIINYHDVVLAHVNMGFVANIPKPKIAHVLELAPDGDILRRCPKIFDAYMLPDPSTNYKGEQKCWTFPRPLEPQPQILRGRNLVPVIGTFGFATWGKRWEEIVKAVNKEFSSAVVRINIPPATYVPNATKIFEDIKELCLKTAKPGIQVEVTDKYMTKSELIEWCFYNDLNCFLYMRPGMEGLAAATDQAISARQPLVVSADPTFRHIHKYLRPYPEISLTEALDSGPIVEAIAADWHPLKFQLAFHEMWRKQIDA